MPAKKSFKRKTPQKSKKTSKNIAKSIQQKQKAKQKKRQSRSNTKTSKKKQAKRKNKQKRGFMIRFIFLLGFLLTLMTLPFRWTWKGTSFLPFSFRWFFRFGLFGVLSIPLFIALWGIIYVPQAYLRYDIDKVAKMPTPTLVYANSKDQYGAPYQLGKMHGDNRIIVPHEEVSEHFIQALLAQEDTSFREHAGVDFFGLLKIPYHYVRYRKMLGASTLTMQLARNTYPLGDGINRKLLEIAVALRIEHNYDKSEILEHYMNRIFLGHSMHGIESAAQTYFGISAKELDLSQSAMLAGIIRGPNLYSPLKSIKKATRERNRALDRMVKVGFITKETAEKTKKIPLKIASQKNRKKYPGYVMNLVDRELKTILKEKPDLVKQGNLRIYTTINHSLQTQMKKHIESELQKIERRRDFKYQSRKKWLVQNKDTKATPDYLQAAAVCLENKSGAVLAVVGGRNSKESYLDRATRNHKRPQIASLVKPFVYLAAFNKGMSSYVADTPIDGWPANHDGKYFGRIAVSKALEESRNCAAVHAGNYAGFEAVEKTLSNAGFKHYKVERPSAFLGTGTATPWEVASAYSLFANEGSRYLPYVIAKITDKNGKILYEKTELVYIAANKRRAQRVAYGLKKVTQTGTAKSLRSQYGFRNSCAGKTGTSNEVKDAWFAGYTSQFSCAVWVGFDTPKTIVRYGSGSSLAVPIWARIIKSAQKSNP